MKARHVGIVVLILIVVAAVAGFARRGQARQNPPGTYPLAVSFDPTGLDPSTVQVYQNIQNVLTGFTGYPDNRAAFFAGYTPANDFNLTGWLAQITAAQQNGAGYLATVSVMPYMTDLGSDAVITDLAYSEQYQVNNDGTFSYVGSLDPNGQAGLVSSVIDLY